MHADEAYCQPCVSPIWDTGLACHALLEAGGDARPRRSARPRLARTDAGARPARRLDGAAARSAPRRVGLPIRQSALSRRRRHRGGGDGHGSIGKDRLQRDTKANYQAAIARAREWIVGMQSGNGGWGAFDADNDYYYLNNIPFADHGALLDPPTEDVTARCLSMLAQLGDRQSPAVTRAVDYLRRTQLADGSWYGRWGMNYIYGTWSVLCALNAAGLSRDAPELRKAVDWLAAIQNDDGGWGEDGASYRLDYKGYERRPITASQTAWALLGLMAAGESIIRRWRAASNLAAHQGADGFWDEARYTATGFPRVFYLRYHGYREILPAMGAGALPQSQKRQCARRWRGGCSFRSPHERSDMRAWAESCAVRAIVKATCKSGYR